MDLLTKLFHAEPFRSIYIAYRITLILTKPPIWSLIYLRQANRPRSSWTWTKCIGICVVREMFSGLSMRTGRFNGRDVTKEVAAKHCRDARFIWLEGVSSSLITGQIKQFADAARVKPVRIPGYGFGQWGDGGEIPLARDNEKIVLHFHGGAYVLGTAHPEDFTANISRGLIQWGQGVISRTLSVEYRLSASAPYAKAGQFPSGILDALAGYVYLMRTLGFQPQNVIVAGDSAGGNLTLAFARYLRDNLDLGIGTPGGLLLLSPWADPTGNRPELAFKQGKRGFESDYIEPGADPRFSVGHYGIRSFIGDIPFDTAKKNVYISPGSLEIDPSDVKGMFTGFPPIYLVSGEGEALLDEIRTLHQRMLADMPRETVVYDEVADAPHDFTVFPFWEPERTDTFKRVAAWIEQL
ncbi:alpha/beta-hydrolase [Ceratobasidium sp. AG-I]|nr:alpha/beta-hydrolase [Ceratobasidium sp. AG-I]